MTNSSKSSSQIPFHVTNIETQVEQEEDPVEEPMGIDTKGKAKCSQDDDTDTPKPTGYFGKSKAGTSRRPRKCRKTVRPSRAVRFVVPDTPVPTHTPTDPQTESEAESVKPTPTPTLNRDILRSVEQNGILLERMSHQMEVFRMEQRATREYLSSLNRAVAELKQAKRIKNVEVKVNMEE